MHSPKLTPKRQSFPIRFGQRPLSRFKDYRQSIRVRLIKYDDRDSMLKGTYKFVKATWADTPNQNEGATEEEMKVALEQMLSGKALGLGLETVNLMFEISGISHIDAQQITRQRVGVTFSAQCTGDRFLNHHDILVEESIAAIPEVYESFIDVTLRSKDSYSRMVDTGVSIQAARSILPRNIETFYYMNTNLATLLFFHQKRIDDGSQTWQMNVISQQMADEVSKIYPELTEVFEKNKTKFKFQTEASKDRGNTFSTSLYIPARDEFDYNDRDFLYQKKKVDMHFTNTPVKDRYFWGYDEITKSKYEEIKHRYDELDKEVQNSHWSNDEIFERARAVTKSINTDPINS